MFIIPYRDENPSRLFPFLTLTLIVVNTYFFVISLGVLDATVLIYGFSAHDVLVRPQGLITSIFFHIGWLHLLGNMWFLWLFGASIEHKSGLVTFLTLYLLAGIAGNLTHAFSTFFQSTTPVIGASGSVAGIMGAYLYIFPWAKVRCVFLLVFYPILFKIRAFWLLGGWLIAEFLSAYAYPMDYVAHWAHIGGFAFGFSWAYMRKRPG